MHENTSLYSIRALTVVIILLSFAPFLLFYVLGIREIMYFLFLILLLLILLGRERITFKLDAVLLLLILSVSVILMTSSGIDYIPHLGIMLLTVTLFNKKNSDALLNHILRYLSIIFTILTIQIAFALVMHKIFPEIYFSTFVSAPKIFDCNWSVEKSHCLLFSQGISVYPQVYATEPAFRILGFSSGGIYNSRVHSFFAEPSVTSAYFLFLSGMLLIFKPTKNYFLIALVSLVGACLIGSHGAYIVLIFSLLVFFSRRIFGFKYIKLCFYGLIMSYFVGIYLSIEPLSLSNIDDLDLNFDNRLGQHFFRLQLVSAYLHEALINPFSLVQSKTNAPIGILLLFFLNFGLLAALVVLHVFSCVLVKLARHLSSNRSSFSSRLGSAMLITLLLYFLLLNDYGSVPFALLFIFVMYRYPLGSMGRRRSHLPVVVR